MMAKKEPWDRLPQETPKAWEAFKFYRDMGIARSIRKAIKEHYNNNPSKVKQLGTWSSKFNWVKRCEEWDAHYDKILQIENAAEVKRMGKRHAKIGMEMQTLGAKAMKQKTVIGVSDAVRMQTEGVRIERLARGEASDKVEIEGVNLIVKYPKDFKPKKKNE